MRLTLGCPCPNRLAGGGALEPLPPTEAFHAIGRALSLQPNTVQLLTAGSTLSGGTLEPLQRCLGMGEAWLSKGESAPMEIAAEESLSQAETYRNLSPPW